MKYSLKEVFEAIKTKESKSWEEVSQKTTLQLFQKVAERVPAYKDFLRKNEIDPKRIKTFKDFSLVPPVDKDNYIRSYAYEDLVWDKDIKKPTTIHSTSGSTGEPTYFQRNPESDLKRQFIIEMFFRHNRLTTTEPTLFIITFGMGVWSAGMGIYTAAYLSINSNHYPISIISPGVNKAEVFKILRNLAPQFKQIVIAGYPPFIKDIVDNAPQEGIDLKNFSIRFIFTGESFTEEFRDYLLERVNVENLFIDTMNTYGTSEFGATAVETPLSIFVRRLKNNKIPMELFGNTVKIPTLAQYIPYFINFECLNEELFITGDGTMPLVKYRSGDSGGIITYQKLEEALLKNDIDLEKESKRLNFPESIYKLPLVFVYERKNLTTTLYGVLIYPEFVKTALFNPNLARFLTGKFTIIQKHDEQQDQYLEINLELKKDIDFKKEYEKITLTGIMEVLKARSSEFRELFENLKDRVHPKLIFWPYEDEEHFGMTTKQKWVKKV